MSADNNPMVLVELNNLSVRYGTSIYAVDQINGTMYGKFSMGYIIIPEKATIIPQYQQTSMETEYPQTYENTLPGITNIAPRTVYPCDPSLTYTCGRAHCRKRHSTTYFQ